MISEGAETVLAATTRIEHRGTLLLAAHTASVRYRFRFPQRSKAACDARSKHGPMVPDCGWPDVTTPHRHERRPKARRLRIDTHLSIPPIRRSRTSTRRRGRRCRFARPEVCAHQPHFIDNLLRQFRRWLKAGDRPDRKPVTEEKRGIHDGVFEIAAEPLDALQDLFRITRVGEGFGPLRALIGPHQHAKLQGPPDMARGEVLEGAFESVVFAVQDGSGGNLDRACMTGNRFRGLYTRRNLRLNHTARPGQRIGAPPPGAATTSYSPPADFTASSWLSRSSP